MWLTRGNNQICSSNVRMSSSQHGDTFRPAAAGREDVPFDFPGQGRCPAALQDPDDVYREDGGRMTVKSALGR